MALDSDRSAWTRVKFGDVVLNVNENVKDASGAGIDRVIGLDHLGPGELVISRWGNTADETTFTRRVRPGQTLFGKRRAYQRKTAYADFDAICSGDILVFTSKDPAILLPEFLPFIATTDSFYAKALETSAGSLSPRTRWSDIATYEFNLPPIEDQKRIADLLWAVEKVRRSLHEHRRALRVAWETWRDDWLVGSEDQLVRIDEIATVRSGATPHRGQQARFFAEGTTPWVKTLDLNEGIVSSTDEQITDIALRETSCCVIPSGTVLVAMYGGFAQIGRTARLGIDAATNQAVSALTNLRADVSPEYLQLMLQAGRKRWRRVAASSRKDPNITKKDVEAFTFPLASPVEQRQLLSASKSHGGAQAALDGELATLNDLTRCVLGKLRGEP